MEASKCETYVRVLPSSLPNSNFESSFLNTFAQLTTCSFDDEGDLEKEQAPFASMLQANLSRDIIKEGNPVESGKILPDCFPVPQGKKAPGAFRAKWYSLTLSSNFTPPGTIQEDLEKDSLT